jgi:hypothetical protein
MPAVRPQWYDRFLDRQWHIEWDIVEGTPIALIPVLQINAKDVPEFPFPPGKDLLQLLWYPLVSDAPPLRGVPKVFWRNIESIVHPLADMPLSPHADPRFVPYPCVLNFERVIEYPDSDSLTSEQYARLNAWLDSQEIVFEDDRYQEKETIYQFELSVCPGNKLGGYMAWIQDPEWRTCDRCGRPMEHLLTLTDMEVNGGTWQRWLPLEDRKLWDDLREHKAISNAPGWRLGGGGMFYQVCRHCADWPVKVVYQR